MALHRYFGVKKFTQIVIEAYQAGNPIKPTGCSGNLQMIFYNDAAEDGFPGSVQAFGTMIKSTSYPEYVHSLNHVLSQGAEINPNSASQLGMMITCSYVIPVEITKEIAQEDEKPVESVKTETSPFVAADAKLFDLDYAKSLKDVESEFSNKYLLKKYAETFGIKLSKAMKFDNMLEHLISEIEE